jgi:DNA-binding NarL/FixJ family response regulator
MESDWYTLTDLDAERLERAITQSEEYAEKLAIFTSAFIAPDLRYLQLAAHQIYDDLSKREKTVFEMKLKGHECTHIARALKISRSSARVYWARALSKCAKIIMSPPEV